MAFPLMITGNPPPGRGYSSTVRLHRASDGMTRVPERPTSTLPAPTAPEPVTLSASGPIARVSLRQPVTSAPHVDNPSAPRMLEMASTDVMRRQS